MAGLSDLIHSGVRIAKNVTATLQMTVYHAPVSTLEDGVEISYTRSGEPNHGDPVARQALVDDRQELKRATDGTERLSRYKITLLESVTVHPLDRFTFASGDAFPPILAISQPLDTQGAPFLTEIWF